MKLSQKLKIAAARAGFLASLGVTTSLFVSGIATAHPVKYRDTQVNPILVMAAADDFRAPPTKIGIQTANSSFATADDFRAPPSDPIQTGSTGKLKNCSRIRYLICRTNY
jgi:hypothetical protein